MRTIQVGRNIQEAFDPGSHAKVSLSVDLHKLYRRPRKLNERRLGLKILHKPISEQDTPETFEWKPGSQTTLYDATRIQNIFWLEGIAPRVIDIVRVDTGASQHFAQVVEVAEDSERGDESQELHNTITEINTRFGIERCPIDPNPHHRYKDIVVTFSNCRFVNDAYKQYLIAEVEKKTGWGSNPRPYQSVPELGIEGQRELSVRMQVLPLEDLVFTDKTVIDYGCSSGDILRYANKRGAVRCVGLEVPDMVRVNYELANYLGCFNIDFYGGDFTHHDGGQDVYERIKEYTGLSVFDKVMYLSCQQLKWPDYFTDIVGEELLLEGHVPDQEETYRERLESLFPIVLYQGKTTDHGPRPVFLCKR